MSSSFVSVIQIKLRRTDMSIISALDISKVRATHVAVFLAITAVTDA